MNVNKGDNKITNIKSLRKAKFEDLKVLSLSIFFILLVLQGKIWLFRLIVYRSLLLFWGILLSSGVMIMHFVLISIGVLSWRVSSLRLWCWRVNLGSSNTEYSKNLEISIHFSRYLTTSLKTLIELPSVSFLYLEYFWILTIKLKLKFHTIDKHHFYPFISNNDKISIFLLCSAFNFLA